MARIKHKPATNLSALRYEMADILAQLRNGEITQGEATAMARLGMVIVNGCKVESMNNMTMGVTKGIDYIVDTPKQISNEFFEQEK
jgi:hypothetical protein